jgi:hypothetical protein
MNGYPCSKFWAAQEHGWRSAQPAAGGQFPRPPPVAATASARMGDAIDNEMLSGSNLSFATSTRDAGRA